MNSTNIESLCWLADALGLPFLDQTHPGPVIGNSPARLHLGDTSVTSFAEAIETIIGVELSPQALSEAIEMAKSHGRFVASLHGHDRSEDWRVLLVSQGPHRLAAVIAPGHLEHALAVQRRAAVVDLAAGVSHEVANALSAIIGWTQLAQRTASTGGNPQEALSLIEKSAQAARNAAQVMLSMSREPTERAQDQTINVGDLIEEVVRLMGPAARDANVQINCQVDPQLLTLGVRSDLWTVLWNLIQNAVQALGQQNGSPGHVHVVASGSAQSIQIVVEDNGPGIEAAQQARIFDRYFTTKPTGTGLGLSMVQQSLRSLSGTIELESETGVGSRFVIALPRAELFALSSQAPSSTTHASQSLLRGKQILVVDEDNAVRDLIATLLDLEGAEVTAVGSAEEAKSVAGPFDLGLIDLVLSDARGDVLLSELRLLGIVDRALLVTGTANLPDLVPGGTPNHHLRKPFDPKGLIAAADHVLRNVPASDTHASQSEGTRLRSTTRRMTLRPNR